MKCPKCSRNHQHKLGMKCTCGYPFTFDPKKSGVDPKRKMTDGRFLAIVRKVSGNGTYYYTIHQLHAEMCRRAWRRPLVWGVATVVAAMVAIALIALIAAGGVAGEAARSFIGFAVVVSLIAALSCMIAWFASVVAPPTLKETQRYVDQWLKDGKPLEKLIEKPSLQQPPPEWPEPDVYDYGAERVLVVDRDLLVDLFVLNGFHTEQRTLVISMHGYPQYLMPRMKKLLAESPDLRVFLLHDSTTSPEAMRDELARQYDLSPDRIVDLGLSREDVRRIPALRPLKPQQTDGAAAIDSLPWPRLSHLTAASVASGVAFGAMLDQAAMGASGGDGGGFGVEVGDFG